MAISAEKEGRPFQSSGVISHNLQLATVPDAITAKKLKFRWLLVEVAGKLIEHGRQLILKIAASVEKYRLYREMRRRTYTLSSA